MTSQLPKIDRWHSEPLNVHRWSEHPEIKSLCDHLYADANLETLEPKGNRKARRNVKDSLRVLILDLYVKWLPFLGILTLSFYEQMGKWITSFQVQLIRRPIKHSIY